MSGDGLRQADVSSDHPRLQDLDHADREEAIEWAERAKGKVYRTNVPTSESLPRRVLSYLLGGDSPAVEAPHGPPPEFRVADYRVVGAAVGDVVVCQVSLDVRSRETGASASMSALKHREWVREDYLQEL